MSFHQFPAQLDKNGGEAYYLDMSAESTKRSPIPGACDPWPKGKSGNPGGRPKASKDFRQRCRSFMEKSNGGWDMLIGMTKHAADRRFALEMLMAYGYGRPSQRLALGQDDEMAPIAIRYIEVKEIPRGEG